MNGLFFLGISSPTFWPLQERFVKTVQRGISTPDKLPTQDLRNYLKNERILFFY